jgi:hypothetical protein
MQSIGLSFDRSSVSGDRVLVRALATAPLFEPPTDLRDDVRTIAARGWDDRVRAEYVGVMIVRKLHGLLVDLNAPMDLQEAALAMLVDEQRHAALCSDAARSLGSDCEIAFEIDELQQRRASDDPEVELLAMLVGTYACGEVVAHALIRHALRALPPSGYREVLRRIARDEVLHARFGPLVLQAVRSGREKGWLAWPGDEQVARLVQAQQAAMLRRDVVEPDEAELFADPEAARQLVAVGIPPSDAFVAAYRRAVHRAIPKALAPVGLALPSPQPASEPTS